MNARHPYLLVLALLALFSMMLGERAVAQNCPRGMLNISGAASYVATPGIQALNLTHGFTIECWVLPAGLSPNAGIIDKGHGGFSAYGIFLGPDSEYTGVIRRGIPDSVTLQPADSFYNWHHIALVYRPGDSLYLFVDSVRVASRSARSILSIDSSTDSIRIGMSANGASFIGLIDEVRIWNTPRSLATIRANMFNVVPGTDTNLVLYYTFDDGEGLTRVHDFSGHGRDGFLRGPSVDLVTSNSPIRNAAPGWQLASRERQIVIRTLRCVGSFDTVIYVHNIGPRPDTITSYTFNHSLAFSSVSNFPIPLRADSSYYVPIDLHFEPGSGGSYDSVYNDSLFISSTNECGGILGIAVHASYDSVGLLFNPSVLAFDSVYNCLLPRIKTVTVTNVSLTDSVTLESPVIPSGSGLILLTQLPRRLAPGQTMIDTFELLPGKRGPLTVQAGIQLDKCSRIARLTVTGFRQQPELSLPRTIDFGAVPADLAGITRDTTILVTNTGNVDDAIQSVTSSDATLTILDGRENQFRAPGDTLQLHVRLHPKTCGHLTATLRMRGVLCATDTLAAISIDVVPPAPLIAPAIDVGRICPTGSVMTEMMVVNPNDRPVRLDSIGYSTYGVFFNPPLFPYRIPAGDSIQIEFLFQPQLDGDFVDTAYFQMSPCGTGIAVLRGSRGYPGLAFNAPVLSFGRGCDTTPIATSITLTNGTARSVTITDTIHYGSPRFNFAPFSLPVTLAPGESKQFAVRFKPHLGELDTGSFVFIGAEGCVAVTLPIRGSREIARAAWSPPSLEFDTVCHGTSKSLSVQLANLGIDTIDIKNVAISGVGFSLDSTPNSIGGKGTFTMIFNSTKPGEHNGVLTLTVDDCGTQFTLPLHATGGALPEIVLTDSLLNFDSVHVGDSVVRCITLKNPSCTPLHISIDTSGLVGFAVHEVPILLLARDSIQLCVTFRPFTNGSTDVTLNIASDSATGRTITLLGVGLSPNVLVVEQALDFGYVLRGAAKTLDVHLSNIGNEGAVISATKSQPEFTLSLPATLPASGADVIAVTFKPDPTTSLVLDTLLVRWSGHVDTVFLRGEGTDTGLLLSAHGIDFGDVHVTDSLSIPLYITATEGTPSVKSVMFMPPSMLRFSDSATVPHTITSDHDTLTLNLTYHPLLEVRDTARLIIEDDSARFDTVLLTGRGVEAHVQINPLWLKLQPVTIGDSNHQLITIRNIGTYPLFVTGLRIGPDFRADQNLPGVAIDPGSQRGYQMTFLPKRARTLTDTLYITTTSPDVIPPVILIGTGVYPLGEEPSFGYSVASTLTRAGDRIQIPVSIFGTRISKIDADSATLDVSFDPSMVLFHGTLAGPASLSTPKMRRLTDSTVEVTVAMDSFAVSPIFILDAEALLGPNPTSYIHVIASSPAADQAESKTDGLFQVADCGGPVHGVVFAGDYRVSRVAPNPTSSDLTISYQLGLDGPVTIDLYDPLGRVAKHIDGGSQKQGQHTASIDLSSLPAGRYVYRLTSLEYHEEGAVLVVR
ncbi:MAG: choice-of-anchor D domain-containing protein [Bacteroidota bacterium]|nr:choice-of-anchor D domain-containing protein [Bacteroidota bacterium]MDP4234082.1 choice-of-anchor D domain-containing protein [Bacteroidota bacterium]MDP4243023.1 choice-of-anchor D domain-containing protein [Bacteroidota bacterium]MDP4287449.1 choice-of-anchor D domain-containing protein [Bacteroidota bacterium]